MNILDARKMLLCQILHLFGDVQSVDRSEAACEARCHASGTASHLEHRAALRQELQFIQDWLDELTVLFLAGFEECLHVPVPTPGGDVIKRIFSGALVPILTHRSASIAL